MASLLQRSSTQTELSTWSDLKSGHLYPRTGEKDPFSKLTPGVKTFTGDHFVELNNMIAKGTQK